MPLTRPNLEKPCFYLYPKMRRRVELGLCSICAEPIVLDKFKDDKEKIEFTITGSCPKCQNEIHEGEDE